MRFRLICGLGCALGSKHAIMVTVFLQCSPKPETLNRVLVARILEYVPGILLNP